jgi:esterase/lipase superfamily enzyme
MERAQPPAKPATRSATAGKAAPAPAAGESPDWDVVPVFYGTDRANENDPKRAKYSADRANRLELGRALVTVPKSHQTPLIERPWAYRIPFLQLTLYEEAEDPKKHFTLKDVGKLTEEEFLALVKERLAASKSFKDHALVFVHGFNTSFDYALYRTAQIAYDLKFDGAPFVYSWPSRGSAATPFDYTYDRESAEIARPHLKAYLELVAKKTGATSVSIIAHSMGNQVLLPVLEELKREAPEGVRISEVILAAPDMERLTFQNFASRIAGFVRGVTLYASANDRALQASKRFWGGDRAGEVPEGGPIILQGLDTIDVTNTSTDMFSLGHSGYAETTELINDIQLLLQTGERPPKQRVPILETVNTASGDYWRYPTK